MTRMPLNQTKRSDYYFGGEDGKSRQFSRKQAGELLADIDEAERQLRDYYDNADENYQIVEGIITTRPISSRKHMTDVVSIRDTHSGSGPLYTYKMAPNGYLYDAHAWRVSVALLSSWIHRLSKVGIITYWTDSMSHTAGLLSSIYKNEQKPPENHSTLQRYIIPRVVLEKQDPFIKTLVSLSAIYKLGVGEKTAKSIAKRYKSLLDISMAEVEELCECAGVGKKTAEGLLRCLGREL